MPNSGTLQAKSSPGQSSHKEGKDNKTRNIKIKLYQKCDVDSVAKTELSQLATKNWQKAFLTRVMAAKALGGREWGQKTNNNSVCHPITVVSHFAAPTRPSFVWTPSHVWSSDFILKIKYSSSFKYTLLNSADLDKIKLINCVSSTPFFPVYFRYKSL